MMLCGVNLTGNSWSSISIRWSVRVDRNMLLYLGNNNRLVVNDFLLRYNVSLILSSDIQAWFFSLYFDGDSFRMRSGLNGNNRYFSLGRGSLRNMVNWQIGSSNSAK